MPLYEETVTGGVAVEVYGGLAACDAYLLSSGSKGAKAYRALPAGGDDRKRALIDATRYIDRLRWQGTANGLDATTLAFPRDGLMLEGDVASDADQLALVEQAAFELAGEFAAKPSGYTAADTGSNVKALGAGKARVEFWGPTRTKDGTATKLPTVANDLIGQWLAAGAAGAKVSLGGTSSSSMCSNFSSSPKRNEPL